MSMTQSEASAVSPPVQATPSPCTPPSPRWKPRSQAASSWRLPELPRPLRNLAACRRPSSASATPPRPPAPSCQLRPGGRRPLVDLAASGLGVAASRRQRPRAQAVPVRPRTASPSSTPRLGPGLAALEGTERALFEKKRRIRQALEEGKPIPTELRNEEHELRRQIDLEDQERQGELFIPYLPHLFRSSEWNAVFLPVCLQGDLQSSVSG